MSIIPEKIHYFCTGRRINAVNMKEITHNIEDNAGKDYMLLESSNVYSSIVGQNFG